MKKNKLDLDLHLPDAPDFISKPPRYSLKEMIKLSEPLLPFWNQLRRSNPDTGLRNSAPRNTEPFRILEDNIEKPN